MSVVADNEADGTERPTDNETYPCAKGYVFILPNLGGGYTKGDGHYGVYSNDGGIPSHGGTVNQHRADEDEEIRHGELRRLSNASDW